MICEKLLVPIFFEDDNRRTVTVTGKSYRKCIQEYLLPEMEDPEMHEIWFQQDETPWRTPQEWQLMVHTEK